MEDSIILCLCILIVTEFLITFFDASILVFHAAGVLSSCREISNSLYKIGKIGGKVAYIIYLPVLAYLLEATQEGFEWLLCYLLIADICSISILIISFYYLADFFTQLSSEYLEKGYIGLFNISKTSYTKTKKVHIDKSYYVLKYSYGISYFCFGIATPIIYYIASQFLNNRLVIISLRGVITWVGTLLLYLIILPIFSKEKDLVIHKNEQYYFTKLAYSLLYYRLYGYICALCIYVLILMVL